MLCETSDKAYQCKASWHQQAMQTTRSQKKNVLCPPVSPRSPRHQMSRQSKVGTGRGKLAYGLYCLEACIRAEVLKNGDLPVRTHYGKVDQSNELALNHGFPNIENLLKELNDGRKANACGDAVFDEDKYDAEDIASQCIYRSTPD